MQLTRFDRWLRETYVYETHILTLRPPTSIPLGIRVAELPDAAGKRYKHLFIAHSNKAADDLIRQLRENGQMYMTRVVDRNAWFVPFIAPKNKSPSWWLISLVIICICLFFSLLYIKSLAEDPVFRKNFAETLKIMNG